MQDAILRNIGKKTPPHKSAASHPTKIRKRSAGVGAQNSVIRGSGRDRGTVATDASFAESHFKISIMI